MIPTELVDNHPKKKSLLLKVALGSVCFVASAAFLWHESIMLKIDTEHTVERNMVIKNIRELKFFILYQGEKASSTNKVTQ